MTVADFAEAKSVSLSQIPIIDISEFLAGGDGLKVAQDIFDAATNIGFFTFQVTILIKQ